MRNPSYFHRGGDVPLIGQPIPTYLAAVAGRHPETEALAHPKVVQAAVFGVADERYDEELGAWLQLKEGEVAEVQELRDYIAEGMAHFKVPRYLRLVDDFPMTVTGKIQKFRMRKLVERELEATALAT